MKTQKAKSTMGVMVIILTSTILFNCTKKEDDPLDDPYKGTVLEEKDFSENFVGEWRLYEIVAERDIDLNSDNHTHTRIFWPNRGLSPEQRVTPELSFDCPFAILKIDENFNYTLKKDSFCGEENGLDTETGTYTIKNGDRVVFSNKFSVFDQALLGTGPIELNTHLVRPDEDYEMWMSRSVNFGFVLNYVYYNKYDATPTKLSFIFQNPFESTEMQPDEIIAKILE